MLGSGESEELAEELQAGLEAARLLKRVDYNLGAATVQSKLNGKVWQMARLVQWLVFAVEPATAGKVDAGTMAAACAHVEANGSDNQREIARLCERMRKLKALAASSAAGSAEPTGEQENAEAMFAKAQAELESRFSTEPKFTLAGFKPE